MEVRFFSSALNSPQSFLLVCESEVTNSTTHKNAIGGEKTEPTPLFRNIEGDFASIV